MSGKQEPEIEWTIFRVKDARAHFVGTIEAPNEETAVARAMQVFKIGERHTLLPLRRPKAQ